MSANMERHPFLLPAEEVAQRLGTDMENGLTTGKVVELHKIYPPNQLDVAGGVNWYRVFSRQLVHPMNLVLLGAMAISFGILDWIEAGVIVGVILVNVSVGFYQEFNAERSMESLRALSSPSATVIRNGKMQVIPNAELLPGDIIALKMGDTVPADVRLFEAMNLTLEEQSLTGEAAPVEKTTNNDITVRGTDRLAEDPSEVTIGDRINIAYGTTTVLKGRGRGIVVSTGMETEVGKIAAATGKKPRKPGRSMNVKKYGLGKAILGFLKRSKDGLGNFLGLTEGTPLQRKLAKLAYILLGGALLLGIIVFAVHRFDITFEVLQYAVSTGIAIIPECLGVVLTITFVYATKEMKVNNVLVRDLKALEALGGVTAICSDKTGTLTQGAMIVKRVWLASSEHLTVRETEDPNNPTMGRVTTSSSDAARAQTEELTEKRALTFDIPERGRTRQSRSKSEDPAAEKTPELEAFLLSSALCNIAHLHRDDASNQWSSTGEPTEIALQVFAHRFDSGKKTLQAQGWAQVAEFPFDSSIKRMSVVYNAPRGSEAPVLEGDNSVVFTKGAVERVLDLCSQIGIGASQRPMTEEGREKILEEMTNLASKGLRVLAVACKNWDGKYNRQKSEDQAEEEEHRSLVESDLTLLGLAGIYDPPRTETKASLAECAAAGIRVHMLTGDHFETAAAIAKEIRIIPDDLSVMSPSFAKNCVMKAIDFDKLTDQEIDELPELPLVLARCAPSTKTRMIDALHRRDGFVAMTGDGVNDAPSLSRADVGIAMGSGSDVAKSAAKIVLTDDKFDSIVAAIRTGRRLFDNIQKFMLHLLTSNVGEVILLIAGLGFRDAGGQSVFPISPLQILLINVATSSFPAFGLSYERAAHNIMKKQPNDKRKGVFTPQIIADMLIYGLLMGIPNLMTFVIIVYGVGDGGLGADCNRAYSDVCSTVFRARGAIYVELTWMILFSAWEFKSIRRSLFRLNPGVKSKSALFKDLWENRFLFWAVVLAVLSVFPVLYIPTLNTKVFKHMGISWEWGIVVPFVLFFLFGIESWKFVKRRMGWFEDQQVQRQNWEQGEEDADEKKLRKTLTFGSLKSWSRSFSKSRRSASRGARSENDGVEAADRV